MIELKVNESDILMRIRVKRTVSTKEVVLNSIVNLLSHWGSYAADKGNIILTKDTLYLEYIAEAPIGYGEETRNIYTIPLKNILSFSVESKDNDEMITIATRKKELAFFRDNSEGDNLALIMKGRISELKDN